MGITAAQLEHLWSDLRKRFLVWRFSPIPRRPGRPLFTALKGTAGARCQSLEAICVDTSTGEPAMAAIPVGLPTRHRPVFVRLDGATVGPDRLARR
ncbi:hypothetical protein ACGFMM_10280 [Streptomyces sp. NPDC048604]|uniref:hypothetical protein n=1 Tax=Streptomyces sp. NPDC048604 TaxID=3365578 RepID=UPI0037157E37